MTRIELETSGAGRKAAVRERKTNRVKTSPVRLGGSYSRRSFFSRSGTAEALINA